MRMSLVEIQIESLGSSGEGVGHHEGKVVFVPGAIPSDRVQAQITINKKNYAQAALKVILSPSADRITPPCSVAFECGGCPLMIASYPFQKSYKRQKVIDAVTRLGKLKNIEVQECVESPELLHYRNKIQLPVRGQAGSLEVGLFAHRSHRLIPIQTCWIHRHEGQKVLQTLIELLNAARIEAYDPSTHQGHLRHILVRTSCHDDTALVVLVTYGKPLPQLFAVAKALVSAMPSVQGVVANINQRHDNVILGSGEVLLAGQDHIFEKLNSYLFKVSARSFFQVNPLQAENLYRHVMAQLPLTPSKTLLDLYCGVGTLSLIASPHFKEVIGVEVVERAVIDAQENAKRNDVGHARFLCGDVAKLIQDLPQADVVFLNPPRQGCAAEVLHSLLQKRPLCLIYISCDPATLARDLAILVEGGYAIAKVTPFDMFPQTSHVETVVVLRWQ